MIQQRHPQASQIGRQMACSRRTRHQRRRVFGVGLGQLERPVLGFKVVGAAQQVDFTLLEGLHGKGP